MSLRAKLFLLLGGVIAVLLAAQWMLGRRLARDVGDEVSEAAFSVSEALVTRFALADAPKAPSQAPPTPRSEPDAARGDEPDAARGVNADAARGDEPHAARGAAMHALVGELLDALERSGTSDEGSVRVQLVAEHRDGPHAIRIVRSGQAERIPVPLGGARRALETFQRRLLLGSVGLLAVGLALAGIVAHRVTSPLAELAAAARSVGEGGLGTRVESRAGGEVGEAIDAFNRMSAQLRELDDESRALRAREHLTELGEVAQGLAHGLRNPLNALGLTLEELASGTGPQPDLASAARRQVRRIDSALRSFLSLAAGSEAGAQVEVDVVALIEDVALEILQDSPAGGVHVETAVPAEPVRLVGVAAELRAAIQALVVNAVEASPPGGRVRVELRHGAEDRVVVHVDDEGPGLPADVRARMFTPHLTTKAGGSGMGLFLAHRIATGRHGGSLEIGPRSDGAGTRASLSLRSAARSPHA